MAVSVIGWLYWANGQNDSDPGPPGPHVTTQEEHSVFSAFLTIPNANYTERATPLGVEAMTFPIRRICEQRTRHFDRFLKARLKGISARTIDSFFYVNTSSAIVAPSITSTLPVVMESRGFEQLSQKYMVPPGLISFSRVGFHDNQALLYVHQVWGTTPQPAGGGTFVLFERKGTAWAVKSNVTASRY